MVWSRSMEKNKQGKCREIMKVHNSGKTDFFPFFSNFILEAHNRSLHARFHVCNIDGVTALNFLFKRDYIEEKSYKGNNSAPNNNFKFFSMTLKDIHS